MTDTTLSNSSVAAPPARFNFAQHLLGLNAGRADKPAFVDDYGALSYGALDERVRRMAAGLQSLGLRREERVLLLMHDCTDWPLSFLGAMYAGLVPVAVNTLLTADDYAYMLEHSRAQAVLVSGGLLPTLTAAMTRSDHEVSRVIVSRPQAPLHGAPADVSPAQPVEIELEAFLQAQPPASKPAATGADDPGFWLYSLAPPADPKAPCIRMPTPTGRPSCTASRCCSCKRVMSVSPLPSCFLLTDWATA